MSDLKPCPFCGLQPIRTATVRRDGTEFNIHYWCNHQDRSGMQTIETGHFGKEQYAVDCWNARPVADAPGVDLKEIAKSRAEIRSCRENLSKVRDMATDARFDGMAHLLNTEIARLHALLIQFQRGR